MNLNKDSDGSFPSRGVCRKCRGELESGATESKITSWMEKCSLDDSDSCSDSEFSTDISTSNSSFSTTTTESITSATKKREFQTEDGSVILESSEIFDVNDLHCINSSYGNVNIKGSHKSHVGDVTNFHGPVYITVNKKIFSSQSVTNQAIINMPIARPRKLFIQDRNMWLAQPPIEQPETMDVPAKYVIICHTETGEGTNQYENILLVRNLQSHHIQGRKWHDIAYNFLVGADGNVYEGRGWNAIGAHTYGYNNISVGIAFIGTFTNKLPSEIVLNQAKALIETGVKVGGIDKEYRLLGHCQCRPFESPGQKLYEEIKTWDNWYDLENLETTSTS